MKKILFLSVLVLLTITLIGCNKKNNNIRLVIKESSWSGWEENYTSEETTKEYDIVLNKEYNIGTSYTLNFKIESINEDSIVIKTTQPFSDKDNGIDLNTDKTEFTLYFDKELELTSPTMDAGSIYYLTLKK